MAAKKLPPGFRKAAKKVTQSGPSKGDRVVDPEGKTGTVKSAAGGMVKVRHDNGGVDYHPAGSVRKLAAPTTPGTTSATSPKKKTKSKKK